MSVGIGWNRDKLIDDFAKSVHALYKINRHKFRMIKIKKIFNDRQETK